MAAVDDLVAAVNTAATAAAAGEDQGGAAAAGPPVTAAHLGAFLEGLAEQGQELHGRIRKHVVRGTTAY